MKQYKDKYERVEIKSLNVFYDHSPTIMIEYLEGGYARIHDFSEKKIYIRKVRHGHTILPKFIKNPLKN